MKLKKVLQNEHFKIFALTFLIALLMFLPNIIKNKGLLLLSGDFQTQQIAFNVNLNNEIKSGNTLYTLDNDLGSSIIEGYSFYNVINVFTFLGLLFPAKIFPYLIGIFLMIKIALAGLFAYVYLKRFTKNKNLAVLGALMYSFSGYQINSILFYHYQDLVLLFPLFLYSIDKLFIDGKKGLFAIIFALTILTNYQMAFGEIIFLIIYLTINGLFKRYKYNKKNIINFSIEFLIAVGLSLCILVPSLQSVFGNPRVSKTVAENNLFLYPFEQYIKIFQALLIPPDTINNSSLINVTNWSICEMWLPLFGLLLVCLYLYKHKKDYLSILIFVLFIFMFIPVLNSSFTLFNSQFYARWYYMLSFFLTLASIKALDEKISIKSGINLFIMIWLIYILLAVIYICYLSNNLNGINSYYFYSLILSITSILISILAIKKYYKSNNFLILIIPMILCILLEGYHYIYYQSKHDLEYKQNSIYINAIDNKITKDNEFYRIKYLGCPYNMNLYFNTSSIDSFNSTISPSVFKVYSYLNIYRKQNTSISLNYKNLIDFYSTKYLITCGKVNVDSNNYDFVSKDEDYYIYTNKNYKKFGLIFNSVISNNDLDKKQTTIEKIALYTNNYVTENKSNLVIKNAKIIENKSHKISNGVYSKIALTKDATVLYTIPYDKDFNITVNGKKTSYFEINNGFIAVNLSKGTNEVKIIYQGTNFKKGLLISLMSLIIFIIYIKKPRRKYASKKK